MKRAAHILIILSMIWSNPCIAQQVTAGQARLLAHNFFLEKSIQQNNSDTGIPQVNSIYVKEYMGVVLYYVVQYQIGGFIIVSADRNLVPVLGYSLDGVYDADKLPDALSAWMKGYEDQIITAHQYPFQNDNARALWNHYLNMDSGYSPEHPCTLGIGPLFHSKWEQGSFYNAYCPSDPAGPSGHTYTGCVATAMAQVMYHFRHPSKGNGSFAYYDPDYDTISADFGSTQYRWNEMVPWIMGQENSAVAELIYHCGVSVKTYYGANGSGANTFDCVQALADYFNYKQEARYYYRTDKTIDWKDSLIVNLDAGKPIIYRGGPFWSAHCFVCDGYADTSYYHFNFGWWQGNGNGYYYLDDLTPFHYTFTDCQAGVFNIYPAGDYPPKLFGTSTLSTQRGSFTDGSGPTDYPDEMDAFWIISPEGENSQKIMLYFNEFHTEGGKDFLTIYDGDNINAPVLGQFSGNLLPPTLTSSGNTLLVHFTSDEQVGAEGWSAHYSTIDDAYCQPWTHKSDTTGYVYDGSWIIYDYADNSDCYWLIEPEIPEYDSISGISFSFTEFNTEENADYLRIYNGATINDPMIAELSGSNLPDKIIVNNTKSLLRFSSNGQVTSTGFMGSYKCIFPEYCVDTTLLAGSSGIFGDGSGTKYYNNNSDCHWLISPTNAEYITITFNSFDIETGYDWLKIYDPSTTPPEILAFLTGDQVPEPLIFNKPELLIQFHTDHLIKKPGWEASYMTNNLGMEEHVGISQIELFPNPSSGFTVIRYRMPDAGYRMVDLYSISGVKVKKLKDGWISSGEHELELDFSNLPDGCYFVKLQTKNSVKLRKLIIGN